MKKIASTLIIIFAGEAIFMLPFLIPRLLRPAMLDTWGLTNTDIGLAFSAYGLTAFISYFLGGPIADKYSPRKLISFSLLITAIAGTSIIISHKISANFLISIYGFFGFSTIFFMWSPLIKMTHNSGGKFNRSRSLGYLDAGRGIIAALMSTVLTWYIGKGSDLKGVYFLVTFFTVTLSAFVYLFTQDKAENMNKDEQSQPIQHQWNLNKVKKALTNKQVWLVGIVILASYCGYKNIDNYSIYLVDILGVSNHESSFYTSIIFWMRPIGALGSGFIADYFYSKCKKSRFLILSILLTSSALIQLLLAFNFLETTTSAVFYLVLSILLLSSVMIYALRSIYFAIFDDINIPSSILGTTIGIVSVIGFLPDFFFGAFTGYLIDSSPGILGFQQVYIFVSSTLLIGSIAAFICWRSISTNK